LIQLHGSRMVNVRRADRETPKERNPEGLP
jgi:hypothetical protein